MMHNHDRGLLTAVRYHTQQFVLRSKTFIENVFRLYLTPNILENTVQFVEKLHCIFILQAYNIYSTQRIPCTIPDSVYSICNYTTCTLYEYTVKLYINNGISIL